MELVETPDGAQDVVEGEDGGGGGGEELLVVWFGGETGLEVDVVDDVWEGEGGEEEVEQAVEEGAVDGLPAVGDEVVEVEKGPGEEDGAVDGADDLKGFA